MSRAGDSLEGEDLLNPGPSVNRAERAAARPFGLEYRIQRFDAGRIQGGERPTCGDPPWRLGQIKMG